MVNKSHNGQAHRGRMFLISYHGLEPRAMRVLQLNRNKQLRRIVCRFLTIYNHSFSFLSRFCFSNSVTNTRRVSPTSIDEHLQDIAITYAKVSFDR